MKGDEIVKVFKKSAYFPLYINRTRNEEDRVISNVFFDKLGTPVDSSFFFQSIVLKNYQKQNSGQLFPLRNGNKTAYLLSKMGLLRIYGLSIVPFLPMPIASRSYDNASFTLSIYPPVP